jgi:hypothetical protein
MGGFPGALSPADQEKARELYEAGELTTAAIGARFGVSKNVIIGLAKRHWHQRRVVERPLTLLDRMDALEARGRAVFDALPPGYGRVQAQPPETRPAARNWAHR